LEAVPSRLLTASPSAAGRFTRADPAGRRVNMKMSPGGGALRGRWLDAVGHYSVPPSAHTPRDAFGAGCGARGRTVCLTGGVQSVRVPGMAHSCTGTEGGQVWVNPRRAGPVTFSSAAGTRLNRCSRLESGFAPRAPVGQRALTHSSRKPPVSSPCTLPTTALRQKIPSTCSSRMV
jgi:hypothetical protein